MERHVNGQHTNGFGGHELQQRPLTARETLTAFFHEQEDITLDIVRQRFSNVAQEANTEGKPSIWSRFAADTAICLIMGINPDTGTAIEVTDQTVEEYDKRSFAFEEWMRPHYYHLKNNPHIIAELAREADLKQLAPQP